MDQYSLHNFLIYDGRTLKETPEFQSFQRTYQYKWGAIVSIIYQLEDFLTRNDVKLAIVNGPQVFELAKLNLPMLKKDDLFSCISNIDQVEAQLDLGSEMNQRQMLKVVIKMQALARMFLAVRKYRKVKEFIKAAIRIQSMMRMVLSRVNYRSTMCDVNLEQMSGWNSKKEKLKEWWAIHSSTEAKDNERTLILIPSLTIPQYIRLHMDNLPTLQNTSLSNLYCLADPSIELLYISPFQMSSYQITYNEKFLSLMGISTLPKRLSLFTPECSKILPSHLTLAQQLWCSPVALHKLRCILRRSKQAIIIPSSIGWAEKRLAAYFNIPFLGPEPSIAETISSRSYLKALFMEANINIPIGAHDIYSMEDLIVAMSRLIASNLNIMRWVIRLNYDFNNESCVIFEVEKLSILTILRAEQKELMGDDEDLKGWFSRPTQLSIRRRLVVALKKEFFSKIRICRKDIYESWDDYAKLMKTFGAVVEAEPIDVLGHIVTACFVDPLGKITVVTGAEKIVDENNQMQSYHFPQSLVPAASLDSASRVFLQRLYEQYDIIGYITLHFMVFWDQMDKQPRLWATDLSFGNSSLHGALGTASLLLSSVTPDLPLSLCLPLPEGKISLFMLEVFIFSQSNSLVFITDRHFMYIPIATHEPLKSTHDDMFFKLCRMRGIAYDAESKVGTLFFLPDTTISGSISFLCISRTRQKVLELAIMTLAFVQKNYGVDKDAGTARRSDNLSKILVNIRKALKYEISNQPHSTTSSIA